MENKRLYKEQMARVKALPEEYQYVFKKIQTHMWHTVVCHEDDMLEIHYGLIDLFETSAADGKRVLEITGEDVAAFCDELAKTYPERWREALNADVKKHTL